MYVRVVDEAVAPGVEDGEEPEASAEMARVPGDLLQRVGRRAQKKTVHHFRVLQGQRRQELREREDHMRVGHRQHLGLARLEPAGLGTTLALRTVAVAARVVRDLPVAAGIALVDVAAQPRRPARHDRVDGRLLLPAPATGSVLRHGAAVPPEDLGELVPRSLGHLSGAGELSLQGVQWTHGRLQALGGHMRVDRRGPQRAVAQQHLDHPQVRPRLQQMRGEAVA